jgi:hypothetical protein
MEPTNLPIEERIDCPACGSMKRAFAIEISDTVQLHSTLTLKAKSAAGGRPFMKQKVGDDLHRKTGKWMKLEGVIDRVKDWYKEAVTDPETGQVIHHVEEPLSDHQGHGSARNRNKT